MNRVLMKVLKISGIVALIGIAVLITGLIGGGYKQLGTLAQNTIKNQLVHISWREDGYGMSLLGQNAVYGNAAYDAAEINNMEIVAGGAKICVVSSQNDRIEIESDGNEVVSLLEDSTLIISNTNGKQNSPIIVRIPSGTHFKSCDIDMGGAKLELEELNCDELDVRLGAGKIDIENGSVGEMNLEIGAGDFKFSGETTGSLDMDVAMGNVDMMLRGSEKDYDCNLDVAMGNIIIGSTKVSGMTEHNVANNSDKEIDIDCGAGNVRIGFIE